MSEFQIYLSKIRQGVIEEKEIESQLQSLTERITEVANNCSGMGSTYRHFLSVIKNLELEVKNERMAMQGMHSALSQITEIYLKTEQSISSYYGEKKCYIKTDVDKSIDQAYEKNNISDDLYNLLKSLTSGSNALAFAFFSNFLQQQLQDKGAELSAAIILNWFKENTMAFVDRGLVAEFANGGTSLLTEDPSLLASLLRSGAKYGVPIAGTLIDFGMQKVSGEDTGNAIVKTAAHAGIGLIGFSAGSAAGAAITGAAIGSVIPGLGTAIGFVVGAIIGVGGSMAFDYVYDHRDEILDKISGTCKELENSVNDMAMGVGSAVSGLFSGLGSVFSY